MDIRHLKYFLKVAEAGSFVAASRELGISQPSLSSRIKEVEAWAGQPLFRRLPRGVSLTEAGDRLIPHAREILAVMDRAERAVLGDTGYSLSLGVTPSPGVSLVPQLLTSAAQSSSPLNIQVQQGSSDELLDLVTRGRLDAALCYRVINNETLVTVPLYSEDLFVVGAPAVVDATDSDIAFDEIVRFPLVLDPRSHATRRRIEEVAFRRKLQLEIKLEVEPANAKRAMIEGQGFCAVVPKALYADAIRSGLFNCRRIVDPTLTMSMGLVVNLSVKQRAFERLRELLQQLVRAEIETGDLGWRRYDG